MQERRKHCASKWNSQFLIEVSCAAATTKRPVCDREQAALHLPSVLVGGQALWGDRAAGSKALGVDRSLREAGQGRGADKKRDVTAGFSG